MNTLRFALVFLLWLTCHYSLEASSKHLREDFGKRLSGSAHNHTHPYDVDFDGYLTVQDALRVIDILNSMGIHPTSPRSQYHGLAPDVNDDGVISALDALLIIHQLNNTP